MRIIGIDPGSTDSGFAVLDVGPGGNGRGLKLHSVAKMGNDEAIDLLKEAIRTERRVVVAIESIEPYGKVVGREVFTTCYMIGRVVQRCVDLKIDCVLYPRQVYARAITGSHRPNDASLRKALLMRFGSDKPGKPMNVLKGSSEKRSAFAVALYHADLASASRSLPCIAPSNTP